MVALNTAYAAPKNAADPKNRVGDFFHEDHASVGQNRWASRLNTQEKSSYHYETASGRSNWSNRDPIQEQGGLNLYGFVENDPISYYDILGRRPNAGGRPTPAEIRQNTQQRREEHWAQNENQTGKLPNKAEDARGEANWNGNVLAKYHQQGQGGAGNQKYVSPDGHYEAVYDKNGNLVTDVVNRGTYNKNDPVNDKFGHLVDDVIPYWKWGNGPDDPTTMWERIWGSYDGPIPPNDDEGNGGGGSDSSGGGGGSPPRDMGDHDGDGVPNHKDDDFNPFEPENPTTCQ